MREPRNTAEGTEATSAALPRAMQGPGQRLSGWRGRGFEGPVRERGRLQTVQGRTDGHAAPRLRARAVREDEPGCAGEVGGVGEWESSSGSREESTGGSGQ